MISNRVISVDVFEKVTFEQILEGDARGKYVVVGGRVFKEEGVSIQDGTIILGKNHMEDGRA